MEFVRGGGTRPVDGRRFLSRKKERLLGHWIKKRKGRPWKTEASNSESPSSFPSKGKRDSNGEET